MTFRSRILITVFTVFVAAVLGLMPSAVLGQPPDTMWARIYQTDYVENNMALHETQDGGFMMAGFYYDSLQIGTTQGFLRKIDRNGNEEWFHDYGGEGSDLFEDGIPTSDGGYILAGYKSPGEGWVVKTDAAGDTMWTRHIAEYPSEWRDVYGISQTEDGGYVLVGLHDSEPGINYYLIKLRPSGDVEWMRYHSDGWQTRITINEFHPTCDGGYILVGYFLRWVPPTTPYVAYVAKVDGLGYLEWSRRYERPEGPSRAYYVDVHPNGDLAIVIGVEADDGIHLYLMRLNSQGEMLWDRWYDETLLGYNDLLVMPGGNYLLSASDMSRRQAVLVRMNAEGDTVWTRIHGLMPDYYSGDQICLTHDGGIGFSGSIMYVTGELEPNSFLVRLEPEFIYPSPESPASFSLSQNYPNPFNNSTRFSFELLQRIRISLKVFNEIGQEVVTLRNGILPCGTHCVAFDGSDLPSGVYFYRLQVGNAHEVR